MTLLDILKGLTVPDQMGVYEESDSLTSSAEDFIEEVLREAKLNNLKVTYFNGASQLVFIEEGGNRVYKFPFDGMMEEWDEYIEDKDDYEWHEAWRDFNTDYTAKTLKIYQYAVEEGVDEFFADIKEEAFSFNHCVIYSQAFVIPRNNQCKSTHPSEDSLNKAKKLSEFRHIPFSTDWTAVCIEIYGEDKFNQLLKFLDEYNVTDLHQGNYGYTRNGVPMLLDYAGYDE